MNIMSKEIKVGDIAYFTLLDLNDRLKYRDYSKLDLLMLDKLRYEVEMKIEVIHAKYNAERELKNQIIDSE